MKSFIRLRQWLVQWGRERQPTELNLQQLAMTGAQAEWAGERLGLPGLYRVFTLEIPHNNEFHRTQHTALCLVAYTSLYQSNDG